MITYITVGIVGFFTLWFLFINVMTWKKYQDKIPKVIQYPLYAIAGIGYIVDVLFNWFYGTAIFLQLPKQLTLTKRLRLILITENPETSWRFKIAYFMCTKLIEPWDYNHCGLENK